jgi:hypothetical protein
MSIKNTLYFTKNCYHASFQDHVLSGNSVATILQARVSSMLLLLNVENLKEWYMDGLHNSLRENRWTDSEVELRKAKSM